MRCVLVVLLVVMAAGPVQAHIGDQIYLIPELTSSDLAAIDLRDTTVTDWQAVLGEPTLLATDFYADPGVGDGAQYDPDDLDFRIWLGWDRAGNRIWGAIERTDDLYVNEYAGGGGNEMWKHDSWEIMLDGDQSGGDYTSSADPAWTPPEQTLNGNRTAQEYEIIVDVPPGEGLGYLGNGSWPLALPFGDAGGGSLGAGPVTSIAEFCVTPFDNLIWNNPAKSLVSPLHPDKVIGLQINVPDFDSEPMQYHAFHILSGQPETWRYADRFVDARLITDVEPGGPPPPRIAVNYPDSGAVIGTDRVCRVQWYADTTIVEVKVELSLDNGDNWQALAANTPNDGLFEWQVLPSQATDHARIRVSDLDGSPEDVNSGPFQVFVSTPDLSGNGSVDFDDFFVLADRFWSGNVEANLDGNGVVDYPDFFLWADNFGRDTVDVVIPYPAGPGPGPYANAGAHFILESPVTAVTGGQEFEVTVRAQGLVDARVYQLTLFDVNGGLDQSAPEFASPSPATVSPGIRPWDLRAGAFAVSAPLEGNAVLGTFTLKAASYLSPGNPFQIQLGQVMIGPNSVEMDLFNADMLNQALTFNTVPAQNVEWVGRERRAPLAEEPVTLFVRFFQGSSVNSVQALLRPDGSQTVIATVPLTDDGLAPDQVVGDRTFTGRWSGTSQVGVYQVDVAYQDEAGSHRENDRDQLRVAHTVLSLPTGMLASPEQQIARVPVLIEDDGSGYLNTGFLAAQFAFDLWRSDSPEAPLPARPTLQSLAPFLTDQEAMLDSSVTEQTDATGWPNWHIEVSVAAPSLLRPSPAPGRTQLVLAYVDVPVPTHDQLNLLGMAVPTALFEEAQDGVAVTACCDGMTVGRGDIDTSRVIDAFDASLVLYHVVHKLDLDQPDSPLNDQVEAAYGFTVPDYAQYMADVSGQMGITALDAALILRRDVGYITHFPAEEGYYRLWEPPAGWWNPPQTKPVGLPTPVLARVVSLGQPMEAGNGLVAVPVRLDALDEILAGSLSLIYDPAVFEPAGVRPSATTAGYLLADRVEAGTLQVAFATATPAIGSGDLVELLFRPLRAGGAPAGAVSLTTVELNEGNVKVELGGPAAASALPRVLTLYPNYPNPFNPQTTVRYALPGDGQVRVAIFDLAGQRVGALVDGFERAGCHTAVWDGLDQGGTAAASGVYLYRVEAGDQATTGKMLLIR